MGRNNLLHAFAPKYYTLYPYIEKCGDIIVYATSQLKQLMQTRDKNKKDVIIARIGETEKEAETLKEATYLKLNNLVILPFDREDINNLLYKADDLIDSIDETARLVHLSNQSEISAPFVEISNIFEKAASEIAENLRNFKEIQSRKHRMTQSCNTLNQLCKDAEDVFYDGVLALYTSNNGDVVQLTVDKKIFESFMDSIKRIKDITEAIRTILIKVL